MYKRDFVQTSRREEKDVSSVCAEYSDLTA